MKRNRKAHDELYNIYKRKLYKLVDIHTYFYEYYTTAKFQTSFDNR